MIITICGSMTFASQMIEIKHKLELLGHQVIVPKTTERYISGSYIKSDIEDKKRKLKYEQLKEDYSDIQNGDALLVLNFDKNNIKNYIGANTFIEMCFAYVLNKKIYVLNELPEINYINTELSALHAIVIHNNLTLIS